MCKMHAPRKSSWNRAIWALLALGIVGSSICFVWRGPVFEASNGLDFILVYSASQTWIHGENPYDKTAVDRAWSESGGPADRGPLTRKESALIYPPTTLLLMAPFGALSWSAALPAWIVANIAFLAISIVCISRLARFCIGQKRTWLFVIASLMFMPVHTTFRHGQTSLYALALIALASAFAVGAGRQIGRNTFSGVLLGAAGVFKPQVGLPYLALDVLRKRWLAVAIAIIVGAMIFLAASWHMSHRGIQWWPTWRANIADFQNSGQGDPTAANLLRHQMIDLRYLLHCFVENRAAVNAIALLACATLAIIFWRTELRSLLKLGSNRSAASVSQKSENDRYLLSLSMVSALTLLVAYHRFYDAVLLLFPLAWAISTVANRDELSRNRILASCVLVLMVPYWANSAAALGQLRDDHRVPTWLLDCWCWDHLIMPHQVWALLAMAICFVLVRGTRASLPV